MATKYNTKVVGISSSTLAAFEGTFMAILGLGIAILHSLHSTIDVANSTQSVIGGLAFGLGVGIVSILVLPIVYFGIGWVMGYIHGFIFNVVVEGSGGLVLRIEEIKPKK